MKMVKVAETALNYQHVAREDINYARIVKINDRSIYDFEKSNESPENPNSACEVNFTHKFETDLDDYAVAKVLIAFLEEPTFNTLRTKEQLGYIVSADLSSAFRLLHLSILVQSSVKDADFLEHRINEFLAELLRNWDPTPDEIETIKASVINRLKQKRTSLGSEASFNWGELLKDEFNFDSDLKLIAAIEKVNKERLLACFRDIVF